jgi:hypothetical protein
MDGINAVERENIESLNRMMPFSQEKAGHGIAPSQ